MQNKDKGVCTWRNDSLLLLFLRDRGIKCAAIGSVSYFKYDSLTKVEIKKHVSPSISNTKELLAFLIGWLLGERLMYKERGVGLLRGWVLRV